MKIRTFTDCFWMVGIWGLIGLMGLMWFVQIPFLKKESGVPGE